ncbi:chemotaxis protein CheB [Sphingobacterium sp. SRCM116780]|uniref:chemotaxis protein CheB n=1 Tax=Sphingobacterium sp. SRCM116780 TaxID=2907623 RepID=UPI001F1ACEA8|nr:chemotaxis protein CheB [Sphingobacterium sp. SRCM116780]UIR55187.1 chemotaxis protein CheB [Sphingobacterium sp. SRCM116780]
MRTNNKILLLGGSAGGFSVILELLKSIPTSFPIPILVIIHRNPKFHSNFENAFKNAFTIEIKSAEDKEQIETGKVYFAPPGYHLLIEPDFKLSLDISEPVQFSRPSIDVTFESAAEVYKENCIAILFSGANQDGAKGLLKIKNSGGICIVQDPTEAEVPTMPQSAIDIGAQHFIYSTEEIIKYIHQLK